jgi:hypothetical protein
MSIDVRPSPQALETLDWDKGDGLLPAVVQDGAMILSKRNRPRRTLIAL